MSTQVFPHPRISNIRVESEIKQCFHHGKYIAIAHCWSRGRELRKSWRLLYSLATISTRERMDWNEKEKKKKKKSCLCNVCIALSPSGDIAVHWQYTQVVLNLETRSCNFKVSRHRTFIYYAFQCLLSLVSAFSEKSLVYSDTINNLLQECDCTGAKLGTALTALKLMEIEIDRSV